MFLGVAADNTRAATRWWRWKRKTLRKENPCGDKGKGMCPTVGILEAEELFLLHTPPAQWYLFVWNFQGRKGAGAAPGCCCPFPPIPRLQAVPTKGVETWQAQSEELRVGAELSWALLRGNHSKKVTQNLLPFPGSPQGWGICSPAQLWGLLTTIPLKCPNSLGCSRSLHAGTRSSPSSGSKIKVLIIENSPQTGVLRWLNPSTLLAAWNGSFRFCRRWHFDFSLHQTLAAVSRAGNQTFNQAVLMLSRPGTSWCGSKQVLSGHPQLTAVSRECKSLHSSRSVSPICTSSKSARRYLHSLGSQLYLLGDEWLYLIQV